MLKRFNRSKQSGFTLLEMSVVLVIIGMILGAVSIGKDLQRNAEYAKIKQKFVDQWTAAYNDYYEKYGVVLGDSEVSPTLAVNGNNTPAVLTNFLDLGTANYIGINPVPERICHSLVGGPFPPVDGSVGSRTVDGDPAHDLHAFFDQAGIRMPPARAEGREDRYVYLDSNGNPQELAICFQWNPPDTASNAGNVMVLIGLTPDLARQLDEMIDGKPDAREGMFRQQGVLNLTVGVPGVVWDTVNTDEFGTFNQANEDEDQVAVVTAHYKMNQ